MAAAAPCRPLAQRRRWRGRSIAAAHNSGATPSSPSPPLGQRRRGCPAADHGSIREWGRRGTARSSSNNTPREPIDQSSNPGAGCWCLQGEIARGDRSVVAQHPTLPTSARCSSRKSPAGGQHSAVRSQETNHSRSSQEATRSKKIRDRWEKNILRARNTDTGE